VIGQLKSACILRKEAKNSGFARRYKDWTSGTAESVLINTGATFQPKVDRATTNLAAILTYVDDMNDACHNAEYHVCMCTLCINMYFLKSKNIKRFLLFY
jgi:hypothetical protein